MDFVRFFAHATSSRVIRECASGARDFTQRRCRYKGQIVVRLVFHPQGLRPFIENWEVVAARILRRVHREAADNPSDETLKRFLEELLSSPDVPSRWHMLDLDGAPPPFLTINYRWKNSTLRLFSVLTTLGTPLDIGLQELRIESFFLQMKPHALW